MTQHTLFVCTLCRFPEQEGTRAGQYLFNALTQEIQSDDLQIQPVQCMGACSHSCVVALMAANKYTFIFSNLLPLQAADVLKFSSQYLTHPTGGVPFQERPESIKDKLFLVIPPMALPT